MFFIDYQALKNAYPNGKMAEAVKTLEALDLYHCLIAATPKTAAKISKMASSLPRDFLKWIEVCDGGMLFTTTMFCTETYKAKFSVPFDTYNRVNGVKFRVKMEFPSEWFIFAISIGSDYFFFDTGKNDGKVYACNFSEITLEYDSFEQWLLAKINESKQDVQEGGAKPLGIKTLEIEFNDEKEPKKPFFGSELEKKSMLMLDDILYELDEFYFENFTDLSARFKNYFKQSCEAIIKLQKEGKLPEVANLLYAFKIEDILSKNYTIETWAYNKDFYKSKVKAQTGCHFNNSEFFKYFEKLNNDLLSMLNKEKISITDNDIKDFISDSIYNFYEYTNSLGLDTILDCVNNDYFTEIKKAPVFEIWSGELDEEQITPILKINNNKNKAKILKWIKSKDINDCYYRADFSTLDFSNEDFSMNRFLRTDFRHANLENVNFEICIMEGVLLSGANLKNANLYATKLSGAMFDNSILQNANFKRASAFVGLIKNRGWESPSHFPASFRNADLRGANFIGANIEKADFTGSLMDGANFNRDWWEGRLDLTPEQLSSIIFVDNEYSDFVKKEDLENR